MSRRVLPLVLALLALVLGGGLLGGPAQAAGGATSGASITHIEPTSGGVDLLVSVPAGASIDLSGVTVSLDGTPLTSKATLAKDDSTVRRTAVLAIDTSDSMKGAPLAAAKAAAKQYVATLPGNVYLGIVTFAGSVRTALAPTQDRSRADSIIDGLSTSHGTLLYDGVEAAAQATGSIGQRSVLLLSDGADFTSTASLADAEKAVSGGGVLLDAVGLGASANTAALQGLAKAGHGALIKADTSSLQARFEEQAGELAGQVLVTATLPAGFSRSSGELSVSLPDGSATLTASALGSSLTTAPSAPAAPSGPTIPAAPASSGPDLPSWVLYPGIAAVALGLLGIGLALVPRRSNLSPEDRVTTYTQTVSRTPQAEQRPESEQALASAKRAAAGFLRRNAGLEARIAAKLDAAGSDLKPAEWLLIHAGLAVLATLLGLLIGGGNVIVGLIFLAFGVVAPWVYLGLKQGKRRAAFSASLPDTLQLMSGSLSAGLSLAQSVDTVVREGADPIASEFRRVLVETRLGVGLEDAFDGVADRFSSQDFRWVVMAIRIQRQVGGNLAELFDTVADTMRERQYLRRQVQTLAAEGKLSAWVIGALPPLFLVYLLLTQRSYVMPLFHDPRGILILVAGVVWLTVGVFWMSRLVKVEV